MTQQHRIPIDEPKIVVEPKYQRKRMVPRSLRHVPWEHGSHTLEHDAALMKPGNIVYFFAHYVTCAGPITITFQMVI